MKEEQFLDNSEGLSKAGRSLHEERLSIAGKKLSLVMSLIEFTLYLQFRLDRKTTKDARDVMTVFRKLAIQNTAHAARK